MTLKSVAVEGNSELYAAIHPGNFSISLSILRRPLPRRSMYFMRWNRSAITGFLLPIAKLFSILRFQSIDSISISTFRRYRSVLYHFTKKLPGPCTLYTKHCGNICTLCKSMVCQIFQYCCLLTCCFHIFWFYRRLLSLLFYRYFELLPAITIIRFDPALRIPQWQVLPTPALAKPGKYLGCRCRHVHQYQSG